MNRSPINSVLRRLAEKAIPPAEVDLWPALRSLYETRKAHPKGDFSMKRSFANHRRLYFVAVPILAVLLVAAVLLITPQGRAWAQSALQFFTRTQSDTIPAPTSEPLAWVEQTPGVPAPTSTPLPPQAVFAAECGDYRAPRCSIEQMRSKVDFTVQEPASLPAGMYFIGATGGPQEAFITYDTNDHSQFIALIEQPWTGSSEQKGFEVAPGVAVESVPIGGVTGEYVKGSFGYRAGETVETWMPDTGQETLKWSDRGVYYSLMYISHSTPLGKGGLAAVAASLTTAPVTANLTPMPATATEFPTLDPNRWNASYPLTPAQASQQAGFDVWVPSKMPGILTFIGARYDAQYHLVVLFYLLNCVDCDNSLSIYEQPAPNGADCDLCGFVAGDHEPAVYDYGKKVGADAMIETAQIGDVSGQYVEGEWEGRDNSGMKWYSDVPTKSLRWRKDGIAFELADVTWGLSKADVIAIAESMTTAPDPTQTPAISATATPEPTLDPNRWNARYPLTPAQASEQAGFDVLVPSKMSGSLTFIGVRYDAEHNLVSLFYLLDCGDCDNAMYISEQPASNGEGCYFCGFLVGDYATADANYPRETVGADATIETVQIGDGTGQYVKGDWESNNVTGFEWNNDNPTQRLLWVKNGMAFFLYDGTWGGLEKADLIAIAESIR